MTHTGGAPPYSYDSLRYQQVIESEKRRSEKLQEEIETMRRRQSDMEHQQRMREMTMMMGGMGMGAGGMGMGMGMGMGAGGMGMGMGMGNGGMGMSQMGAGAASRSLEGAEQAPSQTEGILSERALRMLNMVPQHSDLYRLQMEYLKQQATMKMKIEQLHAEREFETLKLDLSKQVDDDAAERAHNEWMLSKKRELQAARMARMLQREMPGADGALQSLSTHYEPAEGLYLWFDFLMDIPVRYRKLQIVYCFSVENAAQTKPKSIPVADCEVEGSNQVCVFASARRVGKVKVHPSTRLVLEVQSVENGAMGKAGQSTSIGWTAVDIFARKGRQLVLNAGLHRLPMQQGMVDFSRLDNVRVLPRKHVSVYMRIIAACDYERSKIISVEPSRMHGNYTYPRSVKDVPHARPHNGPQRHPRPAHGRRPPGAVNHNRRAAKPEKPEPVRKPEPAAAPATATAKKAEPAMKAEPAASSATTEPSPEKKDAEKATTASSNGDAPNNTPVKSDLDEGVGIYLKDLIDSSDGLGGEVLSFTPKVQIFSGNQLCKKLPTAQRLRRRRVSRNSTRMETLYGTRRSSFQVLLSQSSRKMP